MSAFGSGPSNGQFWYGSQTNFPGFLYKKNVGVGGRRSTKMGPGGNVTCNSATDLYNKYKPGGGGVGASSTANRRAKNRLATICNGANNCFPCYNTLGQYSNYTHNPNGFIPCPGTINISSGSGSSPSPSPSGTYTVTYNNNTGTGSQTDINSPYAGGSPVTVLGVNTVAKSGYQFAGWNTAADGSGDDYVGGDAFTINANTTLYAKWIIGGVRLVYNPGDSGTGIAPSSSGTFYTAYSTADVVDNTGSFTNILGYTFGGWNTDASGNGTSYPAGSEYTMPGAGTVNLYAQWINPNITYTLTYNANGGSGSPPNNPNPTIDIPSNSTVTILGNNGPFSNSAPNNIFYGWNTAADGSGTSYPVGSTITMNANKTLYAQWGSPPLLTVQYNANTPIGATTSGSLPANPTQYPTNVQVPILGQGSLITPGYTFLGWNGSQTGAGSVYAPGYTFTSKTVTLYAQWAPGSVVKNCGGNAVANQTIGLLYSFPYAIIIQSSDTITIYTTALVGTTTNGTTSPDLGSGAALYGLISLASKVVITSSNIQINTNTTYLNPVNDYNYSQTILNSTSNYWPSGATISSISLPIISGRNSTPAAVPTYNVSTRTLLTPGCGITGNSYSNNNERGHFTFFAQGITLNYSNTPSTSTTFVSCPTNASYTTNFSAVPVVWTSAPNTIYPYTGLTTSSSAFLTAVTIIPSSGSTYISPDMPSYSVQYDGNGATGGNIPAPTYISPYNISTTFPITLANNTTRPAGNTILTKSTVPSTFNGWNAKADGTGNPYASNAFYNPSPQASIILYAQWT